jgi:diguanylate cyclase (GGDEF)-like protein
MWELINTSHAVARNLLTLLLKRVHLDKRFLQESTVIMRQYHQRALTDGLTDLYNRHGMEQIFPRGMSRCQQADQSACLIVVDVDHFREFNNRHGHLVGDEVLVAVADQIQYGFRPTDLKARYGGDEFTVLLPDTTLPQALKTAERVRLAIRGARPFRQEGLCVTVTMGVAAMLPNDTLEGLFGRADAALYHAKQAGRDRVSL